MIYLFLVFPFLLFLLICVFHFRKAAPGRLWKNNDGNDTVNEHSEQEEPEVDLEEDEAVQDDSAEDMEEDMTPTAFVRTMLHKINSYWSDHFISDSVDIVHGFNNRFVSGKDLKLHITNLDDIAKSWYMDLEQNEDIVENHWTEELRGKMIKSPYVPKDLVRGFPKRLPYKFSHKPAQSYFSSPSMGTAGKRVNLPSVIFTKDFTKMPATEDHIFEYYGRQGTLDCQITHKLLELETDIISNITEAVDSLDVSDSSAVHLYAVKEALHALADTTTLAMQSNYRAKSFSIVTACKAKLKIRENVLNRFYGDNCIKDALLGSSFFTNQLFGPISRTLQDKLDSYVNRSEAKLSPKSFHLGNPSLNKRSRGLNSQRGSRKMGRPDYGNFNNDFGYVGNSTLLQSSSAASRPSGTSNSRSNPLFQDRPRRQRRGRNQKGRGSRNY